MQKRKNLTFRPTCQYTFKIRDLRSAFELRNYPDVTLLYKAFECTRKLKSQKSSQLASRSCKLQTYGNMKVTLGPSLYKCTWWLWQYGLWSFQTGDTKLERINIHYPMEIFEFWELDWLTVNLSSMQKSELLKLIILIFHGKNLNN